MYQQKNPQEALAHITGSAQQKLIDRMKTILVTMDKNEKSLLEARQVGLKKFSHNTNLTFFIYSTLANLLIVLGFYTIYTANKKYLEETTNINILLEVQNKKLIEANHSKSDFLENMSHEFLTPLNGIIGFSEIIHDEKAGPLSLIQKEYKVLFNYLLNAIKFSNREGKISVRFQPEAKDILRLEVEDEGIGIREEDLHKLFIAFQQIDSSVNKRYQGAGLGLALTRRIVKAQGGKTGVESTFSKGSTFFAILPYSHSDSEPHLNI